MMAKFRNELLRHLNELRVRARLLQNIWLRVRDDWLRGTKLDCC